MTPVELPGGRLGIAVGDVVGYGPAAAAAMGQLRSALRAYALEGRPPARVMQLLARYADGVAGARGATLAYAVLDPGAREVRYTARVIRRRCWSGCPASALFARARAACRWTGRSGRSTRTRPPRCPRGRRSSCTPTGRSNGAARRSTSGWSGWRRRPPRHRGSIPTRSARRCWTRCSTKGVRRRDDVALLAARALPLTVTPLHLWFAARTDQLAVVREAMRTWLAARRRSGRRGARRAGGRRAVRELGRARVPARGDGRRGGGRAGARARRRADAGRARPGRWRPAAAREPGASVGAD